MKAPLFLQILTYVLSGLLVWGGMRIYRKKHIEKEEKWFSWRAWLESIGNTGGLSALLFALILACVGNFTLNEITKSVSYMNNSMTDINGTILDLKDTSDQLALQGRTAIDDFIQCKIRAEKMLESVYSVEKSVVKVAIFWPMFGADFGQNFREYLADQTKKITFYDVSENVFYYYLHNRAITNSPTQLIFLNYHMTTDSISTLRRFLNALALYKIPDKNNQLVNNFTIKKVPDIEKIVIKHIEESILPYTENHDSRFEVRTIDYLPILLIIVEDNQDLSVHNKKALLFLGNVEMLEKQSPQGGFYTEDPGMIKILNGLFDSIFKVSNSL
jgi:hypothetical protein